MSLLTIEAKNFLVHKELKIDLNKESAIVIGDSGAGKSTLSKLILAHIAQGPYPPNPLTDGQDEGYSKTTHQGPDGKVYTVSRKYVREKDGSVKLDRFEVRGPDGRKKSLEEIMDTVFNGVFTSARFDYNTFFNKKKSYIDRYKYFVDAIGGKTIQDNIDEIEKIMKERGNIGTKRETQKTLLEKADIPDDPKALAEMVEYFAQEKTVEDAQTKKDEHLAKKTPLKPYEDQYNNHAKAVEIVKADEEAITNYKLEIQDIDRQIMELQKRRSEKETQIASRQALKAEQQKNVLSQKTLIKILKEAETKEKANKLIESEAELIYKEAIEEVINFKSDKEKFFAAWKAKEEYQELDAQWNEKDKQIADLKADNDKMLKKLLPLPELSIGEKPQKDGSTLPIVLYNGREFSDDNLSTGEQIQITAAIQVALNPKGDNFIVIPNAQDLGSKLREVQAACKKFNVQYLVEMTKPDEEFRVEVIDSEKDPL